MTFMGVVAVLGATSVPAAAHFMFTFVRPGRVKYATVQLALAVFIVCEAAAGTMVFWLSARVDDTLVDGVATLLFVLGLAWCLLENWQRVRFHIRFTTIFRERDVMVRRAVYEVVDLVWLYARLYDKVVVAKTSLYGEVRLKTGGKTVASISLDDGRPLDLFQQLGIRFLGRYNWPHNSGVVNVVVAYKGNDTWSLDDGTGPEELKFADPPPGV